MYNIYIISLDGEVNIGWIVTMFALFGKMAIASVMSLIFVYAAELFPTFARYADFQQGRLLDYLL